MNYKYGSKPISDEFGTFVLGSFINDVTQVEGGRGGSHFCDAMYEPVI